MENKAIAVYIKTESGDDYLFVYNREMNAQDIINELISSLGDEFGYIGNLIITTNYGDNIDKNEIWKAIYNASQN